MDILIGADLVPTKSNEEKFISGDIEDIVSLDLLNRINKTEMRIFNLEAPLTDKATPIKKSGPNLMAKRATIKGISKIGINLFTLSNNHILDQGNEGLRSTIKELNSVGIDYIGAGSSLDEARKPYIITTEFGSIGVYACCEHEFSVVGENNAGANPFDPYNTIDDIEALRKQCDYIIVLYHGGKEEYRYPSPELQKRCRRMIEKGANFVVCQHTHCVGCEEDYQGGKIIYGQGNFIFDDKDNEYWNTSLLIVINVVAENRIHFEYIPIVKKGSRIRIANQQEANQIMGGYNKRSEEIKNSGFVEDRYAEFAKKKINDYLSSGMGVFRTSLFGKVLNQISRRKIWSFFYREKNYLSILNNLECEAHYELFRKGIKERLKH